MYTPNYNILDFQPLWNMVFFMATWLCWSLPGRYLQLPSATKIVKFFKMVDNDLSGRYLQLPAATKIVHISKRVYSDFPGSYHQLPTAA